MFFGRWHLPLNNPDVVLHLQVRRGRLGWVARATRARGELPDVPVRPECKASPVRRARQESATATRPPTRCNTWRGYSGNGTGQEDRRQGGHRRPQVANDDIADVVVVLTMPYLQTACVFTGIMLTGQLTRSIQTAHW